METKVLKKQLNEEEFFRNFHKELEEIVQEIEEENNILKVFQGKQITIEKFEEAMAANVGQSLNIEIFINHNCITAQWYEELAWSNNKKILSLDEADQTKASTNILLNDIREIIIGEGIYDDHWLVRMHSGLEYFIWLSC